MVSTVQGASPSARMEDDGQPTIEAVARSAVREEIGSMQKMLRGALGHMREMGELMPTSTSMPRSPAEYDFENENDFPLSAMGAFVGTGADLDVWGGLWQDLGVDSFGMLGLSDSSEGAPSSGHAGVEQSLGALKYPEADVNDRGEKSPVSEGLRGLLKADKVGYTNNPATQTENDRFPSSIRTNIGRTGAKNLEQLRELWTKMTQKLQALKSGLRAEQRSLVEKSIRLGAG